ncbi:RpiB/LacA/LacB family sugar-phosphate isomerase [Bacillota bacterium Meth-B3]|nr:RpiB/LacA/LacB family sugar-phosphate isomerase [Christensenellaceae bacterium]MEA5066050.1 RpiB/LacA/LacB family sugar-phosphate isomerase [Eubacteriales bacterium]MEA5067616.1 RpiB/LacA/LacB family sugar-phosphate isomerase [Christensenellaceae bacterium]
MKIAVLNEVSACARNRDILFALEAHAQITVLNLGMAHPDEQPQLTYLQTGIMAGVLLGVGACDLVVGGCGTGQGFLNAALQFPGVCCGLVETPLDAWLFTQINGGNCISLALNKGYGWAGDINLTYIVRELLADPPGRGYPLERARSQRESRDALGGISRAAHRALPDILSSLDRTLLSPIAQSERFMAHLEGDERARRLADIIRGRRVELT